MEFKHTGDGIAAWFLNARAAVECCLRIQVDIREAVRKVPDLPLLVRVGVSAGTVVADEGDVFGLAVNKAFRVCDYATDGRVLVSSDVPPLVREGVHFSAARDVTLKGFTDTETVYEVTTADA